MEKLTVQPTVQSSFFIDEINSYDVAISATLPDRAFTEYGAPREIVLYYTIDKHSPSIKIELFMINKTATRIPEFVFFSFAPMETSNADDWSFWKLVRSFIFRD